MSHRVKAHRARRTVGVLAAVSLFATMAACGDSDDGDADESPANDPAASEPADEPAGEPEDDGADEPAAEPADEPAAEPADEPEADAEPVTLVTSLPENELSPEAIEAYESEHPHVTIERVENDPAKIRAMIAAGTPPDVMRMSAFDLPLFVNQGLILDITSNIEASELISTDDLLPAADYFVIDGAYYGLPKDWSPDFSLFVDSAAFADAGLEVPNPDVPLTYEELGAIARALTVKEGDRTLQVGWNFSPNGFERMINLWLQEEGLSLYSDDNEKILISGNEPVIEKMRFFYDLAVDGAIWTPINPAPSGRTFLDGQSAIQSYGYWFGGSINGNPDAEVAGNVVMLPAPSWTGDVRYNPTWGPTGVVVSAGSPNPDAAFDFLEWFTAGQPALDRASSGWGVPIYNSQLELMPTETDFQQQAFDVVQAELEASDFVIPVNPYYSPSVFTTSWEANLTEALNGNLTFEELISNVESDVNEAIADGVLAS